MPPMPVRMIGALGRTLDSVVCAGSVANAARAVQADQIRAGQRRDAMALLGEVSSERALSRQPGRASRAGRGSR